MKNALAIIALASSCVAAAARAEGTPPVPEGLLACAKLQDSAERVRCYDAQVAAMRKAAGGNAASAASTASPASAASAASAGSAASPRPAASTARSPRKEPALSSVAKENSSPARFGEEDLPLSERPKVSAESRTLESSVTAVSKAGASIYYFSLANGQVWREEGDRVALFIRAGDPIRIRRSTLGAYHMWTPRLGEKDWMYVRRVR